MHTIIYLFTNRCILWVCIARNTLNDLHLTTKVSPPLQVSRKTVPMPEITTLSPPTLGVTKFGSEHYLYPLDYPIESDKLPFPIPKPWAEPGDIRAREESFVKQNQYQKTRALSLSKTCPPGGPYNTKSSTLYISLLPKDNISLGQIKMWKLSGSLWNAHPICLNTIYTASGEGYHKKATLAG